MTLFFPSSTSNVKINASNSQVGVTVGDTMTITAGDTFTIGAGSTSTIKIGPATSFTLGSAVNISLASTLSYTYGFTAAYGSATTATGVTGTQNSVDSYTINAGTYTPVTQALTIAKEKQVYYVLLATVVSMGAIALGVVGGLSSPMFITDPSNTPATLTESNGQYTLNPATTNPNAVKNDSGDVARAACAMAITTTVVFIAQWALTYYLAKSSAFSPVTSMVFNSTGITASAQTTAANAANLLLPASTVPSVETIMYVPNAGDAPTLTHRVNEAPAAGISPQLSEIILQIDKINLNSTTQPGGVATHNTQVILDPTNQTISLMADSVPAALGGNMVIGKNTAITNPSGTTTLTSQTGAGVATVLLDTSTQAALSCTDGTGIGSVIATPSAVNIGVALPAGGNAVFNSTGTTINGTSVKISGTNIDIGGALTILGSPGTVNSNLSTVMSDIAAAKLVQQNLILDISLLEAEMTTLKESMAVAKEAAEIQTKALIAEAIAEGASKNL